MAFNKNAFAAAFLNQLTSGIEDRAEKAEQYEKEQKEAASRNAAIINTRKLRAQEAANLGEKARQLGARRQHIVAAMSSGMTGINDLYEKLLAAANEKGVKRLGEADIEEIVNMPVIPELNSTYIDVPLQEIANRTYGVSKLPEKDVEEPSGSLIRNLFGLDDMANVKQRLQDTEYVEGMSIADINEAVRQAEYTSLFPDIGFSLMDVEFYGPESKSTFISEISEVSASALSGTVAKDFIEYQREKAITEGTDPLEAVEAAKELLVQQAVEPIIIGTIQRYGRGGFFSDKSSVDLVNELMDDDGEFVREQAEIFKKELDIEEEVELSDREENLGSFETIKTGMEEAEGRTQEGIIEEEEATETQASDPEAQKAALLAKTFRKRPIAIDAGRKLWDRNLKGKVDPKTGKVIIAPPRPADGGEKTKTLVTRGRFLDNPIGSKKVTEAEYWDATYGGTHDPETGLPLNIDKLLNADARLLED